MSDSIKIYSTATLNKNGDGKFSYIDTYGELHEFHSAGKVWDHLTEDGEEFSDDIESFVFGE